jgi:hypothetical protein
LPPPDERSCVLGRAFDDYMRRFKGTGEDFAAGVAAHVIRRWKKPPDRQWFAGCMQIAAEMVEDNLEAKIPMLELPRTTVRRLRQERPD